MEHDRKMKIRVRMLMSSLEELEDRFDGLLPGDYSGPRDHYTNEAGETCLWEEVVR